MATFRLQLRQIEYQVAIVEADNREGALRLFEKDHDERGKPLVWEHSDFGGAELIGIDEEKDGDTVVCHLVQDGKFTEEEE